MTKKETERDGGEGKLEGNGLKGEQRETERKGREWKE